MSDTSVNLRHTFLLSARSSQSHATSCSNLMSYCWVNNKCNRVKRQHWRWLIHALCNFSLCNNMLRVSEATTTVLESFRNSTGKHLCWSLFLKKLQTSRVHPVGLFYVCFSVNLIIHVNYINCFFRKMMKLYKDICSAGTSCTSAKFFLIDWCHKRLKNTIDLLLFYGKR